MSKALTIALLQLAAISSSSTAQVPNSKEVGSAESLENTICWDFTTEDKEGRGLILMLHYGYVLGRYGKGEIRAEDVKPLLTTVARKCHDMPDLTLVDAFKQAMASNQGH